MRAFVAIDLPAEIHAALAREQSAFRAVAPDAKWTRAEGIHLTLKFLGHISDDQVSLVAQALTSLGRFEAFSIEVVGFGFFPDAHRPGVFWAGVEAPPALAQLASSVENALEPLGFAREARRFSPHLTLARFKTPRVQPALTARVSEGQQTTMGRFECSEFFLLASKLTRSGAEYRKVARFPAQPVARAL